MTAAGQAEWQHLIGPSAALQYTQVIGCCYQAKTELGMPIAVPLWLCSHSSKRNFCFIALSFNTILCLRSKSQVFTEASLLPGDLSVRYTLTSDISLSISKLCAKQSACGGAGRVQCRPQVKMLL